MNIELMTNKDIKECQRLVEETAKKYVYPDFTQEGIQNFERVNSEAFYLDSHHITYLAKDNDKIVGMISLRKPQHICLLFVDEDYHHRSIASSLINTIDHLVVGDLEVNASLFGQSFYQKMGFKETDTVKCQDGITYVPMIKKREVKERFKSYQDFLDFMAMQKDRVYSLDNFKRFMQDFANPQLLLKCIHIGGTNGKGSTTNYIKEVLMLENYQVGTFTSPALTSRLEVIRVNDQFIDEACIVSYANRYVDIWLDYEISVFEIEVFIAIMYFISKNIDFAIFEVGLGGTLDATNIITPLVSVNTNIGLDHIDYLGHSYREIALAKAGIIKEGVDYITGETRQVCLEVFSDVCRQHHSRLIKVDPIEYHINNHQVEYIYHQHHIVLSTPASYQAYNSALALTVLEYLKNKKMIHVSDDSLLRGLYQAHWAGRFDQICQNPTIIVDGAHNKEGIEAFYESAKNYQDIKIVFSALRDKDTQHMIEKLLELTDDVTITQFEHVRASTAKELANGFPVKIDEDFHHAIDECYQHQGTVFITGSLYFISQVIPYIKSHK